MNREGPKTRAFHRSEATRETLYGAANNLRQGEPVVVLNLGSSEGSAKLEEFAEEVVLHKETGKDDIIPSMPLADIGSRELFEDELLIIYGQLSSSPNVRQAVVIRTLRDLRNFKKMLVGVRAKFERIKPLLKQEDLMGK